ncbi:MAG: protein kinase [Armatimonadetes bacterium]|nr:protein kinase [Armatimonadota bacterium]
MSSSTNTLGKYQIVREIARSNDIVYEAIDPALGRRVALKELCLPSNLTGAQKRERIERFLREGKAAGKLAHPNIVTVYDVGQDGDRFYIAMEFLEGQTLRDVLQVRGALPVQEAVQITLQLSEALAYAHKHNVVHRDVKPENVQILPGGYVKLTDFGIARIMSEPSITANGQVFGTPSYMSPEQVSGKQIDGRSDVFSLGVMLYEMLSGQKPFTGDTIVTITYNIMNAEPPAPPGVPPYLVAVVQRAMAKDPNMRFSTVEQMAEELRSERSNGAQPFMGTSPTPGQTSATYSPPVGYSPTPPQPWTSAQPVPDPFAQPQSAQDYAPPAARQPLLSAQTRGFLGILLVGVLLAGMLVFAVYAVNQAYAAYAERTAVETSRRYAAQGDRLFAQGKFDKATEQYLNALRAAGSTNAAADAKRRLAVVYAELARHALENQDYAGAAAQAARAVEADPTLSAGRYYLGAASLYLGDLDQAESELRSTVETGGNDQFAIAARKLLSKLYVMQGDLFARGRRLQEAGDRFKAAIELQDPDWAPVAERRLLGLGG